VGTATTFDERFDDLARLAYRVGYRLLGDRDDAEDVAQEALARAAVRWRKVEPYAEAWVTRVATNLALGQLRRRRPGRPVDPSDRPGDAQVVADRVALVAGLRRLSRRQRETVALRYLADLTEAQVAAALGCTVGTVKQHAARGLAALRLDLGPQAGDPSAGDPSPADPQPDDPQPDDPQPDDPQPDDPPGALHVRPAR
jgi:RNA polymerase sigma factor (sigma-70 family)